MKNNKNKNATVTLTKSTSKTELNSEEIENNFYENIVDTVREPLLILDKDLRVVKASKSFFDYFKVNSGETIGKLIYDLGDHQWDIPKLRELLETILPGKAVFDNFEVEHDFLTIGKRIMLLNARKIETAYRKEKIILLAIEDVTERKRNEKSLREKNELTGEYLDILLEHAHTPIIIWDSSLIINQFNKEFEKLSGYDSSEVIDKSIKMLFPEDKADSNIDLLNNNLNDDNSEAIEIDILTKDKTIKTVLWNSKSIFDDNDKNIVATITYDITSRIHAENRLKILETRYHRLFDSAKDGIIILDAETGKIIDVNPYLCDLLDYSKEKFIDKELWQIGLFKDIAANKEKFLNLQRNEYIRYDDLPLQATSGKKIFVEFVSNVYLVNNHKVIQCNIRDITEHKKIQQKIKDSEKRFRAIFDQSPFAIALLGIQGNILISNLKLSKMIGYSIDELYKMKFTDFTYPEDIDKDMKNFTDLTSGKINSYALEKRFVHKNGSIVWVNLSVSLLSGDSSSPIEIIGMAEDITVRKISENELKESEEKFRITTENSADAIFITDDQGRYTYVNTKAVQMLGYTKEEMMRLSIADISPKDKAEEYILIFKQLLNDGFALTEIELVAKDGNLILVEMNAVVLPNGFIFASCRDIHERVEFQNKIKFQSELLFNIGQAVIATDLEGKVIYWNHAAENIYGWTIDEAMGENIIDLISTEQTQKQASEIMEQLMAGNSWSGEFLVKRKDGSSFTSYVTDTPITDSNGKLIGVIGISTDITEKKKIHSELLISEGRYKTIFNNSLELIYIIDLEGQVLEANDLALNLLDYTPADLKRLKYSDILDPVDFPEASKNIEYVVANGVNQGLQEYKIRTKKGEEIIIETTSVRLDRDGKPYGIMGIARDITDRKHTENEIIKAKEKAEESDKMKSEFLSQMSHEIRTPINVMSGYVDYLYDLFGEPKDSEVIDCFNGVKLATSRIIRTMDLILNAAELQTGRYQPLFRQIDLDKEILSKLYKERFPSASQRGLELKYNCKLDAPMVLADNYSITQIFVNLIDNAIKYTKKGEVEILLTKDINDNVVVEIKDTGIGIAEEFLPKLFNSFTQEEQGYSRSFEGNGLGLALVKSYCEVNYAIIEVESEKNVGSTFRVIFDKKFTVNKN